MNMAEALHFREPMARHVSWRAGGPAERCFIPSGIEALAQFLRSLPREEPLLVVGLGSNLLVRDGGFRGTVILMHSAKRSARASERPSAATIGASPAAYTSARSSASTVDSTLTKSSKRSRVRE